VLFFIDNAKELASKLKFKDEIETYKLTDTALIYGVERKNQNKLNLGQELIARLKILKWLLMIL
jgi:hypothetical protein